MKLDGNLKQVLEDKLFLSLFLTYEEIEAFYLSIEKYLDKKRIYIEAFTNKLEETTKMLQELDLTQDEIIHVIKVFPSIIHANKTDFFAKYLLLVVLNTETNDVRKSILLSRPKDYIIGISTLYARYAFLLNYHPDCLKRYNILKMTNLEFERAFKISTERLHSEYPYDSSLITTFLNLHGNENIKAIIDNQTFGGRNG